MKEIKKDYDLEKYAEGTYDIFTKAPLNSNDDIINRRYVFDWRFITSNDDLGNMWQLWEYRKDISRALWKDPRNKWQVTDEFAELLKKEGFVYYRGYDDGSPTVL